ncbi:probable flavin-containing monooxygenase 1 isoform X2 [Spinacia oleracea]|uniref:Flavin-containing monooxygenase n=1 Tax=Spinacia oleracea TaxID=3562 RepID=A0ABM3QIS7_SPIOL|nr:probable flavin-containing monooxygenase 1 isoform X2 [Spinacia oleracea]
MERKVGIIGAGISGLLACKYALAKGYQPLVFESRNTIGGVWTKTLETTKLQTPKSFFQFSDFPWPSFVDTLYPSQTQVFDYLQSYAKHFDLLKHIRFNTNVLNIKYHKGPSHEENNPSNWGGDHNGDPFGNKGKWIITTQHLLTQTVEVTQVDFVILCLGRFSDVANIPEFPIDQGPEVFEGKVMHSIEYSNLENEKARDLIKGKRVTVVGFKKTALDIAMQCATVNGVKYPCTMICRTPHWNVYQSIPWANMFLNRFSELLIHKPGDGPLLNFLATLLSPLGDQKLRDIFASPNFQKCISSSCNETTPLYRECIHPRIPQLAVIGFSESFANLFASEIRCRWLFELLDGKFKLPNIQEMEKDVLIWKKSMKTFSPKYYGRPCIGALHIWYNDRLCEDMGLNPKRKKGIWAELFEPYTPTDYA